LSILLAVHSTCMCCTVPTVTYSASTVVVTYIQYQGQRQEGSALSAYPARMQNITCFRRGSAVVCPCMLRGRSQYEGDGTKRGGRGCTAAEPLHSGPSTRPSPRTGIRYGYRYGDGLAWPARPPLISGPTKPPPAHRPDSPLPFCPVPPLPTTICALPPILRISPRKTHTAIQISLSTQTNPEHRVSLVTKNHPFPHLVPIPPNPFRENVSASICTLPVAFARLYQLANVLIIFIIIHRRRRRRRRPWRRQRRWRPPRPC
jgi:hypothetical protein